MCQNYIPMDNSKREYKTLTIVTKEFTLHGREYKVGEMISYKEANELTRTMEELDLIAPASLESK